MTHRNHKRLSLLKSAHPGLVLDKLGLYLIFKDKTDGSLEVLNQVKTRNEDYPGDREEVLKKVGCLFGNEYYKNMYESFFENWENRINALEGENKAKRIFAKLESRFITGLSSAAAMQMGFSLHHTYGVYYIPGSSVKGAIMNAAGSESREEYRTKESDINDTKPIDKVIFLDAFPLPESVKEYKMEMDVITPHHTKYYEGNKTYENAPDIEEPVPVFFLAVPPGVTFLFAFVSENYELLEKVESDWEVANEHGFGGKTTSGYGYFQRI